MKYDINLEFLNKFVLFVPYCKIYENFISKCFQSINEQNYENIEVIIVVDGTADMTVVNNWIYGKDNVTVLLYDTNQGPAFSKWKFIEHIQQNIDKYSYNDIIAILDGDDYLNPEALYIVNNTYNSHKCWVTYGNASGKFCDFEIPENINSWQNIRKEKWIYNHIRTCRLFLLLKFEINDFKMNDKWLTKYTDRPFIYNIIEWSSLNQCKHIKDILYNYIEHEDNSYKTINYVEKKIQFDFVTNITPKEVIVEDIHIVMCIWNRIDVLTTQLDNLNEQTVSDRIILHIINNNQENKYNVEEIIKMLPVINKLRIVTYNYNNEFFGFQRFLTIRDNILKKYFVDYIIIIDDDQLFKNDWVEKMYNLRTPKTYYSWYVKKWNKDNLDYWNGSLTSYTDCKKQNKDKLTGNFHYGGMCGSIIDTSIFNKKSKLWDIPSDLPKNVNVYNIEDLWLSFIIIKYYDWEIKSSFLPEQMSLNNDKKCDKYSLWKTLIKEKQDLLEYLYHQKCYINE